VRENNVLEDVMVGTEEDRVGIQCKPVSVVVGAVRSEEAYAESKHEGASERRRHLVHEVCGGRA
jgi:hypothetical protein